MKNKHTLRQSGNSNYATNQRNISKIGEGNEAFLKSIDKRKQDQKAARIDLLRNMPYSKEYAETIFAIADLCCIVNSYHSSSGSNIRIGSMLQVFAYVMMFPFSVKAEDIRDDHRFQHAVDMIAQQDPQLAKKFSHCVESIDDKSTRLYNFGVENLIKACSAEHVIEITQDECWDGFRFYRAWGDKTVAAVSSKKFFIYKDNINKFKHYDELYSVLIHEFKHLQQFRKQFKCEDPENTLLQPFSGNGITNCFKALDLESKGDIVMKTSQYKKENTFVEQEAFLSQKFFTIQFEKGNSNEIPKECKTIVKVIPKIRNAVKSAISLTNDDDRKKHEVLLKEQGFTKKELEKPKSQQGKSPNGAGRTGDL